MYICMYARLRTVHTLHFKYFTSTPYVTDPKQVHTQDSLQMYTVQVIS